MLKIPKIIVIKRKLMIKEIFLHFIEIGCLVFKLLAQTCLLVRTWLLVSDLLERTLLLQTGLLKRTLLGQTGFLTRAWLVQTGLLVGRPVDLYRQVYLYDFFYFCCSWMFKIIFASINLFYFWCTQGLHK